MKNSFKDLEKHDIFSYIDESDDSLIIISIVNEVGEEELTCADILVGGSSDELMDELIINQEQDPETDHKFKEYLGTYTAPTILEYTKLIAPEYFV